MKEDVLEALVYLSRILRDTPIEVLQAVANQTDLGYVMEVRLHIRQDDLVAAMDVLQEVAIQKQIPIRAETSQHVIHTDIDGNVLFDGKVPMRRDGVLEYDGLVDQMVAELEQDRLDEAGLSRESMDELVVQDDEPVQTQAVSVQKQPKIVRRKARPSDEEDAIDRALKNPIPVVAERVVGPTVFENEGEILALLRSAGDE